MYTGFNLTIGENNFSEFNREGREISSQQKTSIENKLSSFRDDDGNLIASKMKANWFPTIEASVFISHSHIDSNLAINLAGWLYKTFGLTSFIDSCIWGYADDLLQLIDDEHCVNPSVNPSGKTYNYKKRNKSTSHVHMMLSTALLHMIDNAECLIFLNTPFSITPESVIGDSGTTYSPWIYTEIAMTRLIRRKAPVRKKKTAYADSVGLEALDESLKIKHDINLDHLKQMSEDDLNTWKNTYSSKENKRTLSNDWESPLDALYCIKGVS